MRRPSALTVVVLCLTAMFCTQAADPPVKMETDEQKTLYAIGNAMSQRLVAFNFTPEEAELVRAGLMDGILGKDAQIEMEEFGPKIEAFLGERSLAQAKIEEEAGKKFVDDMAKQDGATTTESGVVYMEMTPGTGDSPTVADKVKVHYHGTLRDGKVFDSSVERDQGPVEFPLQGVIPCFSEGITKMKVGGKSRLICPAATAYGDRGAPPDILPGATLSFEVELIEIVQAAAAPAAPATP